jgi:hypothetical protein
MDYRDDIYWREVQKYLPADNRLTDDTAPEEYFIAIKDIRVHIDHYKVKNPKARVILFHGVGGNGRLLSFIAIPLVKSGYEVICPDLPLYGCTEYTGTIHYTTWVSCGIEIVNTFHKDNVPVFLFGLSAGGMLAYQVANAVSDISGIIATCILDQRNKHVLKQSARSPFLVTIGSPLMYAAHKIAGSLKLPVKMVANMKAIANDENLAGLLMKDKKSSGASVPLSFIYSMLNPVIQIEPENFSLCPFLLVHPEDDHWTDISLSKLFLTGLRVKKNCVYWRVRGISRSKRKG